MPAAAAIPAPAPPAVVIETAILPPAEIAVVEMEAAPVEPMPAATAVALEQDATPANDAESEVRKAPTA